MRDFLLFSALVLFAIPAMADTIAHTCNADLLIEKRENGSLTGKLVRSTCPDYNGLGINITFMQPDYPTDTLDNLHISIKKEALAQPDASRVESIYWTLESMKQDGKFIKGKQLPAHQISPQ